MKSFQGEKIWQINIHENKKSKILKKTWTQHRTVADYYDYLCAVKIENETSPVKITTQREDAQ